MKQRITASLALTLVLIFFEQTAFAAAIATKAGKTFNITLASNPTTGYSWRIDGSFDKSIVKLLGSKYERPKTSLIGAGGREIWRFKALKPGKTAIKLKYVRPWEKNTPPAERRSFEVKISKAYIRSAGEGRRWEYNRARFQGRALPTRKSC